MGREVRYASRQCLCKSDGSKCQKHLHYRSKVRNQFACGSSSLTFFYRFTPLLQKKATKADQSRVIITASVAGLGVGSLGDNATFGYSASKAAAIHLTRNLAVELGPRHILVNSVAPGFFPSKMANGLMEIVGGQDALASAIPDGRLGQPEDIAGTVVYLASRAAGHVNGANVVIDGGAMWARPVL